MKFHKEIFPLKRSKEIRVGDFMQVFQKRKTCLSQFDTLSVRTAGGKLASQSKLKNFFENYLVQKY